LLYLKTKQFYKSASKQSQKSCDDFNDAWSTVHAVGPNHITTLTSTHCCPQPVRCWLGNSAWATVCTCYSNV